MHDAGDLRAVQHAADVHRYLGDAIQPWLVQMGFDVEIHPNPEPAFGPILMAERLEGPDRPTVLTYGHGDTVRGLDEQWRAGLKPWVLTEEGDRWYGRGTADNKGQHALNLAALEAVLAERGGHLGFNLKLILETSEERGSTGLRAFVREQADRLMADVLIASDGPRVVPEVPTIHETVLKDFDVSVWYSILAAAGTPAPIVQKLNAVINDALRSEALVESLNRLGAQPSPEAPEPFQALIAAETRKWVEIANAANIKLD